MIKQNAPWPLPNPYASNCGTFTLSLDFELVWGAMDHHAPKTHKRTCEIGRFEVIEHLLKLFEEFNISATWCIVGHLFLKECTPMNGQKHPEIWRQAPSTGAKDWFTDDPCTNEKRDPIFYGQSLVDRIHNCSVPQEIGSHSFSHVVFDESTCSQERAESELAACVELARQMGIKLYSFAFPKNLPGYLELLPRYGFKCYRGPEESFCYKYWWIPKWMKRAKNLWDVLRIATPSVIVPEQTLPGLWNVKASMIYFPIHGVRRLIPMSFRIKRAIKGLDAAAQNKRTFHLWLHPCNMAFHKDKMFNGLRDILEHACALRDKNLLEIRPMRTLIPDEASRVIGRDLPFSSTKVHNTEDILYH